MGIYMAFPVALFHYFNQPEYFEEWVTKTRREIYPPDDTPRMLEFKKALKDLQKEQDDKLFGALEK